VSTLSAERVGKISPQSASELAATLRDFNDAATPVGAIGGATKQHIGRAIDIEPVALDLTQLNTVHHYDPGDLTISVSAGMTLADLQEILGERGQFLPLDPMLPAQATVGGILAANAHGPLKSGYGGVRDLCIGIEFVTADGLIAKGGGRVVKNVAGYDLMKLLIGSFGTLGLITAANFKVHPKPRQTHTFIAHFEKLEDALGYRARLRTTLRHAFMAMEIISPRAHEYLADHVARDPDDYAPSAPVKQVTHWSVALRVAGSDKVVARYRRELRTESMEELNDDAPFWQRMSDFEVAVHQRHRNAMVLYVNAPLTELQQVLAAADQVAPQYTMLTATIGRAAIGNLVICFMPLAVDPPSAVAFANAVSAFRGAVSERVSIVAARCPEESKQHFDVWGATPTSLDMMRAVKHALDPNNILNRGRFIVG
jgi:glycolate oxidase FAD binding subunit